ncbi:hypothetical protein [Natronorubrum halophilum]|uniref:hypothetical protein n=1 Tax=Natronorubrum halophilum TaxID=1702106 RepID=UPI0010C18005|nr:hypothetical protein [Natronorubrum halophilum]
MADEYRVLVADRPDLEGEEVLSRLEGEERTLSTADGQRPRAAFLAVHRGVWRSPTRWLETSVRTDSQPNPERLEDLL